MDDTISRKAAIDAMNTRLEDIKLTWRGKVKKGEIAMYLDMRGVIETLPSAQPERPSEIQDILDYLDTVLHPIVSPEHWNVYAELHDMISTLPSAERRGRWIEEYSANHFQAKCSACGESTLYGITYDLEGNAYYMNYCPNCGARMEGGE